MVAGHQGCVPSFLERAISYGLPTEAPS